MDIYQLGEFGLIDEIKNLQSRKTYGLNWEIEEENVVKEFKANFLYLK